MTTQDKRTEDMSVAETMDAIFGEGTAEQTWSGEDLEIARQPYSYSPPPTIRLAREEYLAQIKAQHASAIRELATMPDRLIGSERHVDLIDEARWTADEIARLERTK